MNAASNSSPALAESAAEALAHPLESLLAALDAWREPDAFSCVRRAPQAGVVNEMRLATDPNQRYFLYIPRGDTAARKIFVSVHGISRNAEEHAREFADLAERYGLVVVAPLFDEARYPDYQRLGRSGKGERADLMLDRIVAEAAHWSGADGRCFHLFGYSGGGQFAHRYAMAHPERVTSYAIGAAGWYTLPDADQKYPMGTRASERLPDLQFEADRFLTIPAAVFVGERDVHDGTALRQSEQLRAEQGENRHERGLNWIESMRRAAHVAGFDTAFHFESLPRSPHCFQKSMKRGGLGQRVLDWMFPQPSPATYLVDTGTIEATTPERTLPVTPYSGWRATLATLIAAVPRKERAKGARASEPSGDSSNGSARPLRTCAAGPP